MDTSICSVMFCFLVGLFSVELSDAEQPVQCLMFK